jgi:hypothetical protein
MLITFVDSIRIAACYEIATVDVKCSLTYKTRFICSQTVNIAQLQCDDVAIRNISSVEDGRWET